MDALCNRSQPSATLHKHIGNMQASLDLLGISGNPEFEECLKTFHVASSMGEHLLFSDFVWKTNKRGRKQKRAFVITSQAIYNFLPNKYSTPKRRILYNEIERLRTVWGSKLDVVIESKTDWCYSLTCARRQELVSTLTIIYRQIMNRRLLVVDENEGDLTLKLTDAQTVSKFNRGPAAVTALQEADSDDDDDGDDMPSMQDSIIDDVAAIENSVDAPADETESARSSVLSDAAFVVAQFHERLTAARSGSFAAVRNQYLDDEAQYGGQVKPYIVLYRAMRDALPQPEDLENHNDLDGKWDDDEEMEYETLYPPKVREALNNWPCDTALECSEAVAELLLNPEFNAFVLTKVFSSKEIFMVAKMICATLLRHSAEAVRQYALKNLWQLCNHEERSTRTHLAETFVELVIPFSMGILLTEGVYETFLELLTDNLSWPSQKGSKEIEVFGKEIKNQEILPVLMELMATADLPLRHRVLKDLNLILLHKPTNIDGFFEFPDWHSWIFPLIAEVPRDLPNRSEIQDEMFKYAIHIYSVIFTGVFTSMTLQTRLQDLAPANAMSHPMRASLAEMMEALDGWSGWGTDTVNFARAVLVAVINKIRSRTNALVWKHNFEAQEWTSLLAVLFVVRDFMFFFPVSDGDETQEDERSSSSVRDNPAETKALPREQNVGQLLRKAHADHVSRNFVPDENNLGLHLDPKQGVVEDLGLAKKTLELLDSLSLKHDEPGNTVLDDPTVSKSGKDTYKRAISLRQGMFECVKLFEGLHNGGEAKEEVLFKVCKHLGEVGQSGDNDKVGGKVGSFLLDVVRSAVGSKTKTLKMARRLKDSVEKHSATRSVRFQQTVLADIAAAMSPTSREVQKLAAKDTNMLHAIPEEEILSSRLTLARQQDLVMQVARVGRTSMKIVDILKANRDGLDRRASSRPKHAESAPTDDLASQLETMALAEDVEVGFVECCHCAGPIFGGVQNAVCAIGAYWHQSCFNCVECGSELTQDEAGRFFEYDNKPYCAKDFLKRFAPHLCGGCFRPFHEGDDIVESCGRQFHVEHFLCRECGCVLHDHGAFKLLEDEQYCVDCFDMYIARCPGCGEGVGDDALVAFKRAWHPSCFGCVECSTPLLNTDFFGGDLHDGKGRLPYCHQHFVDKFMPKCSSCHNAVEGGVFACGMPWHVECLRCQRCNTSFDSERFYERRGQPVCVSCYQQQFDGVCPFCLEQLRGSIVEATEDQFYHTKCFVCTSCNAPFTDGRFFLGPDRQPYCTDHFEQTFCEVCAACGLFITDGVAATVADKPWHHKCVQCRDCRRNLLNEDIFVDENDGSLLCREHYSRSASKPCHRCKTQIAGEMISAGKLHFHSECFVCDSCGTALQHQKVFQEGDLFLCETDFRKRVSQACKACQQPITDKFTKLGGGIYHVDCVRCTNCKISLRKSPAKKSAAVRSEEASAPKPAGMFSYKGNLYCGGCVQEAKATK